VVLRFIGQDRREGGPFKRGSFDMGSIVNEGYRQIALKRVSSKSVRAVGYDPVGFALRVQFRSGEDVVFKGVPVHVYSGLLSAGSKSGYCRDYIERHYPREILADKAARWWPFNRSRPSALDAAQRDPADR